MKRRLERGPHAALGIADGANAQVARAAFLQLTKTYHPAKFAREAPEIVRQANEVFLALRAAYEAVAGVKRISQGMSAVATAPRLTPAQGVPVLQRPASGTPPQREAPTVRKTTPMRGIPSQPTDRSADRAADRVKRDRDLTPVRGVPIPPSSATPAAPRAAPLGVSIKGAAKPPAPVVSSTAKTTPDATPQIELPPGVSPGSEEADLEYAMYYLRRKQWSEARKALHALAARNPKEKKYRALLSYARGREAQDGSRRDEARAEFARALQLDPELSVARVALGQVSDEEPPERPSGGLLSRLFKK
jgi:tetratricopeptide (TPR) repeat protein